MMRWAMIAALMYCGFAQAQSAAPPPRLVLVIAIDQFRGDFLQRYQQHFVPGGFNLLLRQGAKLGSDHGSPWFYDRHVPLVFLGPGIRAGTYHNDVRIVDLAPTLAVLLGIERTASAQGRVLVEILR
jgi:hypothetical protein